MNPAVIERLRAELASLREQGLYKSERVLEGPQGGIVHAGGRDLINLCANNYLGLANHPAVRAAAQRSLDELGYGMASVRFICGTQSSHKQLEERLARFLGTEDVILYSSCFDANGGLFETLLDERDAVISRRAEPCEHHRRHPPVQGAALPLRQQRHGRAGEVPAGGARGARPPDRDRRRVLHGRLRRQSARHLRARRTLRRAGHGR